MIRRLSWWQGGILIAILLLFTFSVFGADRPFGASTYVPYLSGIIFDLDPQKYEYLQKVHNAGTWEGVMLLGALFGGLVFTLYYDKFKLIMGSNLGNTTLVDLTKGYETISVLIFGIALIAISIIIPLKQELDEADLKQLDD